MFKVWRTDATWWSDVSLLFVFNGVSSGSVAGHTGRLTLCGAGGHGLEVEEPQPAGVWHGAERGHGGVVSRLTEPRRASLRDVPAAERGEVTGWRVW